MSKTRFFTAEPSSSSANHEASLEPQEVSPLPEVQGDLEKDDHDHLLPDDSVEPQNGPTSLEVQGCEAEDGHDHEFCVNSVVPQEPSPSPEVQDDQTEDAQQFSVSSAVPIGKNFFYFWVFYELGLLTNIIKLNKQIVTFKQKTIQPRLLEKTIPNMRCLRKFNQWSQKFKLISLKIFMIM